MLVPSLECGAGLVDIILARLSGKTPLLLLDKRRWGS